MNLNEQTSRQPRARRPAGKTLMAAAALAVVVAGATWRGLAAESGPTPAQAKPAVAPVTTPIAHAIAGGRDSYADVVNVVSPAVVTVRAQGRARVSPTQFRGKGGGNGEEFFRRFFGEDDEDDSPRRPSNRRESALGSGVVVSTDGYILTNFHVVDGASDVQIDFTDGHTLTAKTVGTDKATDLALLKVSGTGLHALALGNSDAVQVGDVVLAVGNPLGIGQTVTMGIISAKGRSTSVGDGSYEDFLQTDAPINHGNSGGALVNTRGELVGINSQILSTSDGNIGIGFAIPTNMARNVMTQLRDSGKVRRSQLGVTVQPVTSDLAASLGLAQVSGAIVGSVEPGSPADRAGVKRGDVIESFNSQPVKDTNTLRNRVAETTPGATATLVVNRDGTEKTLTVQLAEARPDRGSRRGNDDEGESEPESGKAALGVSVSPLTGEIARQLGLSRDAEGVVVERVSPEGRAADAGVQRGDVIQEVNRRPVRSVDELKTVVGRAGTKPLLLLVNRRGSTLFLTARAVNGN